MSTSVLNAANINQFWSSFNDSCGSLRELISVTATKRDYSGIKGLKVQIEELQEAATNAAPSLPLYDIKRSQQEIEWFKRRCKELELELQPRQAFAFSDYTMQHFVLKQLQAADSTDATCSSDGSIADVGTGAGTVSKAGKRSLAEIIRDRERRQQQQQAAGNVSDNSSSDRDALLYLHGGSYVIKQKQDDTIFATEQVQAVATAGEDGSRRSVQVLISQCRGVVVSVRAVLGSVRLEHLHHCRIYLGPCATSCYIEDCHHCIIATASHQLRIHNTSASQLYVRCHSHPIIEDCADLGFAPYSMLSYDPSTSGRGGGIMARDVETAGLVDAGCWSNVVDFKWHKDTASPHFHVLPAAQYVQNGNSSSGSTSSAAHEAVSKIAATAADLQGAVLVDGWTINTQAATAQQQQQQQGHAVAANALPLPPVPEVSESALNTQHPHQLNRTKQQAQIQPPTQVAAPAPVEADDEDDDEL